MSVYKNENTGKWYTIFRYKDWSGKTIQKKKSGFNLRREALEYERDFLERQAGSSDMKFQNLYQIYHDHFKSELRSSTVHRKELVANSHILPYFADMPVNIISPNDVREWQNEI